MSKLQRLNLKKQRFLSPEPGDISPMLKDTVCISPVFEKTAYIQRLCFGKKRVKTNYVNNLIKSLEAKRGNHANLTFSIR